MLYIASDHGGFKLKSQLIKLLVKDFGDRVLDLGPFKLNLKDDYPKFAEKVALKVAANPNEVVGILLCRSGQGMCIAANKFIGVRAGLSWNEKSAKASRQDDHTNVLCLPSDFLTLEQAHKIIKVWLNTPWGKEKRHQRRIAEIKKIES